MDGMAISLPAKKGAGRFWRGYGIAIASGILCLVMAPYGIGVTIDGTSIDIPWSLAFPMIIAMAYGVRHGLVAAISGGALFPFLLWPDNGWSNVFTTANYFILFAVLGAIQPIVVRDEIRKSMRALLLVMLLFTGFFIPSFMVLFNRFLSLNPAPWQEGDFITSLNPSIIFSFTIKDSVNNFFLSIASLVLLQMPFLRNILGLEVFNNMKTNHRILLWSLFTSLVIWIIFVLLEFALIESSSAGDNSYRSMAFFLFIFSGFIVAGVLVNYVGIRISDNQQIMDQNSRLSALNANLEKALARAEESERLKSAFLANLSHEIRTPMNSIVGFSELLCDDDITPEEVAGFTATIKESAGQLLGTISDIIEISKIETGQVMVSREPVDLTNMMESLVEQAKANIPAGKELEMIVETPSTFRSAWIESDLIKLRQILTNMLSNAIKFTDNGFIKAGYRITPGNKITFFVRDTGPGIEARYHKMIFDRFSQVHGDMQRLNEGSGLGLAIASGYAEMLGATISLKSEPGRGSTFYLELNAGKIEYKIMNQDEMTQEGPKPGSGKEVILIAEDDDVNYLYFMEIFKKSDYTIIRASNGREAVEECRRNNTIDLVLMDLKMPVMDGYEALKVIREEFPALPVVAQTAYALSEDRKKIMDAGFNGYVTKPVSRERLLRVVNEHTPNDKRQL
jgi:signal transduction histidine kinase/CheY-like chemotaxis protein